MTDQFDPLNASTSNDFIKKHDLQLVEGKWKPLSADSPKVDLIEAVRKDLQKVHADAHLRKVALLKDSTITHIGSDVAFQEEQLAKVDTHLSVMQLLKEKERKNWKVHKNYLKIYF
ncbi:MAG: hypothetical protein JWO53_806 [Chlamydiia bacterium]|nr:hypothetical protein [Chlamydiia bacterium]